MLSSRSLANKFSDSFSLKFALMTLVIVGIRHKASIVKHKMAGHRYELTQEL